jgi:histidine ammonia-lyase
MLNAGIHPLVPSRGSVGMSDLVPLAHLALPVIGMGQVEFDGRRMPSQQALSIAGLHPAELSGKDGLALCSANSASVGHGALVVGRAIDALACAQITAALSLEGFGCPLSLLAAPIHEARPYSGQLISAGQLRRLLEGSALWESPPSTPVFEPLSFRCVAQVHGACQDAVSYVRRTVETELNATGDNPVVLIEREAILPSANFHPAGLSVAFDMLGIALAQVVSMAAHRVLKLMSSLAGLPPQLTPKPGVNVGMGVLQKTVTALNSEVRFLAGPASLDFTPVADGIEDHATMATLSVSKAGEIIERARSVLAIELLCAAQAVDLRESHVLGTGTRAAYQAVRAQVRFLTEDRPLAEDVDQLQQLITSRDLLRAANL